jgi:hypothetical protein
MTITIETLLSEMKRQAINQKEETRRMVITGIEPPRAAQCPQTVRRERLVPAVPRKRAGIRLDPARKQAGIRSIKMRPAAVTARVVAAQPAVTRLTGMHRAETRLIKARPEKEASEILFHLI